MILFADGCCFVFSIFTSLPVKENNAASAPEMVNVSNSNNNKATTRYVVLCVSKYKKVNAG